MVAACPKDTCFLVFRLSFGSQLRLLSPAKYVCILTHVQEVVVLEKEPLPCGVSPQARVQPPALPLCTRGASAQPQATALVQTLFDDGVSYCAVLEVRACK